MSGEVIEARQGSEALKKEREASFYHAVIVIITALRKNRGFLYTDDENGFKWFGICHFDRTMQPKSAEPEKSS